MRKERRQILAAVCAAITLSIGGLMPAMAAARPVPTTPRAATDTGPVRARGGSNGVLGAAPHDANNPAAPRPLAAVGKAFCDAATAGPGRPRTPIPVALSAAHNLVRELAVDSAFYPSDDALVDALARDDSLSSARLSATLHRYANALPDTCALRASDATLGRARVTIAGHVAVVRPGTGSVHLPAGVTAGVIDLRGLPAVAALPAALDRAAAPFLATTVDGPQELVRVNDGPTDEAAAPGANAYGTSVTMQAAPGLSASGTADLPLAVLTGSRLAPAAARFAGTLRTARRAWLIGSDVQSAVAELSWRGVGDRGIAVRTSALDQQDAPATKTTTVDIGQDDPNDPSKAAYRHDFTVPEDTQRIEITTHAAAGNDVFAYLVKDLNGDGKFDLYNEYVAYSQDFGPDEHMELSGYSLGGHYELILWGLSVPSGHAAVSLTTSTRTGRLWPDRIAADRPATHIIAVPTGTPPAVTGTALRSAPATVDPDQSRPIVTGKPQLRAALIIAHGMLRRYWRYFADQGDRIDSRLVETLGTVQRWDGRDRATAFHVLQRLGQSLRDGHQLVYDNGPPDFVGYLPVYLDSVDGMPVVRRSAVASIHPGDTIEAIDGRPTRDIYRAEYRLIAMATPGYTFDVASRYVSRMTGPETLLLADPDGVRRSVRVDPLAPADWQALHDTGVTARQSGPLTDLDAPDLSYVRLTQATLDQVDAAIAAAQTRHAKALVVDMRGYPGAFYGSVASRFIGSEFQSTPFRWNRFSGPDDLTVAFDQDTFEPSGEPHWNGPIVLLTGPHAVSAAESLMQMLVAYAHPVAVVGQRSAGTTGDITRVQLPGGFAFRYTGLEVRNVDGSRFMGVGIVPTVSVPVTAPDIAAGIDRDLVTAVNLLHARGL